MIKIKGEEIEKVNSIKILKSNYIENKDTTKEEK